MRRSLASLFRRAAAWLDHPHPGHDTVSMCECQVEAMLRDAVESGFAEYRSALPRVGLGPVVVGEA